MKKSIKPILLAISILIISTSIAGCADSEKTADNPVVNTENTSASSSSAEESVISSTTTTTNPYDTSKPIDTTTPSASSSSESSTNSEPTNSSTNSEPTNSSSNSTPSSSSSSSTNSSPSSSSSSSSSTSTTKPTEKPSSSSGTGAISPITGKPITITIPAGTPGEYFDQYGNPMPDGFNPSNGGYYTRYGSYVMTPEEHAAELRALQEACDKIDNGTFNGTENMTQEEADYLWSLLQ